jgi:hypothetical protein
VPFIVYEEFVDKTEAIRLFGEEIAGKLQYNTKDEEEEKKLMMKYLASYRKRPVSIRFGIKKPRKLFLSAQTTKRII